jgi:hypothetical protein
MPFARLEGYAVVCGRVMPGVRCFVIFLMRVKFTFIFVAFVFCSLAACELAFAQRASDEPYIVPSDSSGEINSREIDSMAVEAKHNGERLFVIARLGAGETSRRLNLARLYNTREYLSVKSFDPQTTIFAEGERVAGEGRIEFYLGSRLRLVTLARRNKMPNLTCCEDYFPAAKSKPKRKKRGNR